MSRYANRRDAGSVLASTLSNYAGDRSVVVLALPRGGVPVAYEVARRLSAPLDVFVVRKLGVPDQEELAMGALASGGAQVINHALVHELGISDSQLRSVIDTELRELLRREHAYRGRRPRLNVKGRTVILIDDGLATGSTMRAAVLGLKTLEPERIIVAVPFAASSACEELSTEVDDIICAVTPQPFYAVGMGYDDFSQTTDEEVRDLLESASAEHSEFTSATAPVEGP